MNHKLTLRRAVESIAALAILTAFSAEASAQSWEERCREMVRLQLTGEDALPSVLEATPQTAGKDASAVPYCLVKVRVPMSINIWVGLPMEDKWNGRLQSLGGGGYAGTVAAPTAAVLGGYVGITTDTGHVGADGKFAMQSPGVPNKGLQDDFAYRSVHLMAVVGKQVTESFYGKRPEYAYWNGCSTGGRQGLMMAQRFPGDYDGILAGAPAIHMDRFQPAQIWPQVVMAREAGGPIAAEKLNAASAAAIEACDTLDGVKDGVLEDPRACQFDPKALACSPSNSSESCLTPGEAEAVKRIWEGPKGQWYGLAPGTPFTMLAGAQPFMISVAHPRYWVYLDAEWDWRKLTYENFGAYVADSKRVVGPVLATDNPNLDGFRKRGGKLVMWHGWSDPGIMPEGTVDYYEKVAKRDRSRKADPYSRTQEFARLFMAPGVGHCSGGAGPQPQGLFGAVVNWVEKKQAPDTILASKALPAGGGTRTRPLCPYPAVAVWKGSGSTDDAANFRCEVPSQRAR